MASHVTRRTCRSTRNASLGLDVRRAEARPAMSPPSLKASAKRARGATPKLRKGKAHWPRQLVKMPGCSPGRSPAGPIRKETCERQERAAACGTCGPWVDPAACPCFPRLHRWDVMHLTQLRSTSWNNTGDCRPCISTIFTAFFIMREGERERERETALAHIQMHSFIHTMLSHLCLRTPALSKQLWNRGHNKTSTGAVILLHF